MKKSLFFLLFLLLNIILLSQQRKGNYIIDTYNVGLINEENKYEYLLSKHNTFAYSNSSIVTSNLISAESNTPWVFKVISEIYLKDTKTTIYKAEPVNQNNKELVTFMVADKNDDRDSFTLLIKKRFYLFN